MINNDIMDTNISEIGRSRFNFTWCTGYPPSRYRKVLDRLIHKDQNDLRPQLLCHILFFNIEANFQNKNLGKKTMQLAEYSGMLTLKQYVSIKEKTDNAQSINTRLLYDLTRIKRVSAMSVLSDLFYNYDVVTHNISALSLQYINVPK